MNDCTEFRITVKTENEKKPQEKIENRNYEKLSQNPIIETPPVVENIPISQIFNNNIEDDPATPPEVDPILMMNYADQMFTPGHIYKSGGKFYGIYRRTDSDRFNTGGKIGVAEVDNHGRRISNFEWRYVYYTKYGKEFFFGISNHNWKIYTDDVLNAKIPSEDMRRYG